MSALHQEIKSIRANVRHNQFLLKQMLTNLEELVKDSKRIDYLSAHDAELLQRIAAESVRFASRIHRDVADMRVQIETDLGCGLAPRPGRG